jgi:hypothetical protein
MEHTHRGPARVAAVAVVVGAAAQLTASVLEPDWGGAPDAAVRVVADTGLWTADRVLDLVGVLLAAGALTVVGRAFHSGPGRDWIRVGQTFLVLMAALGGVAVATGAAMKGLADAWHGATPASQQPYLAAFDAVSTVTEDLFFAAFLALGLYLAALAAAILTGRFYPRWIGWVAGAAAAAILAGNFASLVADAAWLAVLAGFVSGLVAQSALGVSLWRRGLTGDPD